MTSSAVKSAAPSPAVRSTTDLIRSPTCSGMSHVIVAAPVDAIEPSYPLSGNVVLAFAWPADPAMLRTLSPW
ncbi:hypothetical protein D1872_343850 [compost metagenome]